MKWTDRKWINPQKSGIDEEMVDFNPNAHEN